jgi:hypothetical protein
VYLFARSNAFSITGLDPSKIARLSGIHGNLEQGAFKIEVKRQDLDVKVGGVKLTSDFGLKAWLTVSGTRDRALLLGDIPLLQEEVGPTLRVILENGVTPTSLHDRFTMDSPRVISLHIEGIGTQESMSLALGKIHAAILALQAKPKVRHAERDKQMTLDVAQSSLDAKTMEGLLWKGELSNGVFRVELARGTTLMNQEIGRNGGASSWAAFAGHSQTAAVNGDIATLENELPYVLKDLLEADVEITSIHTHLTQESPRLIFVHFFGEGKLETLAAAVKKAIWEKEHFQSQ